MGTKKGQVRKTARKAYEKDGKVYREGDPNVTFRKNKGPIAEKGSEVLRVELQTFNVIERAIGRFKKNPSPETLTMFIGDLVGMHEELKAVYRWK
jgi:hypothetical protein